LGSYELFDKITGASLTTVSDTSKSYSLQSAGGTLQESDKTPAETAEDQAITQAARDTFDQAQQRIEQEQQQEQEEQQPDEEQQGELLEGEIEGEQIADQPAEGEVAETAEEGETTEEAIVEAEAPTEGELEPPPLETAAGPDLGGTITSGSSYETTNTESAIEEAGATDPGGSSDAYFAKIDSNGVLIWEKRTGGAATDYVNDVVALSTGEVVAAGYTESFGSEGKDIYLLKLSETGETIWEKNLGGSSHDIAFSIDKAPSEGFILGGLTGGNINYHIYPAAYLLRINSSADLVWERTYYHGQFCPIGDQGIGISSIGRTAITTPGGGFALSWSGTGPRSCGHTGPGPPESVTNLVKTNGEGTSEWTFSLNSYCSVGPVINVRTGGYLFAYACGGEYHFAKISSSGGEVWDLHDTRYNPGKLAGLIQLRSGNFLVALQTGSHIDLIVISSSGTVINSRIISQNNYGGGDLLVQAPDGNVIIAGWYYADDSNWNIRVLKIRNEY
ncbi:MAG: hypothetical protein IIA17_06350, partial [candidate division Zixibacteria bacterium]|nr:hypothetical protein [candidate division Zixibacteria bacterium]